MGIDVKKMKVAELRAALEERGLPSDGLKAELVNRLQERLDEEEFGIAVPAPVPASSLAPTDPPNDKEPEGGDNEQGKKTDTATTPGATDADVKPSAGESKEEATKDEDQPKSEAEAANVSAPTGETTGEKPMSPKTVEVVKKATNKDPKAMTFEEKKRMRAERFGISVVDNAKRKDGGGERGRGKKQSAGDRSNKRPRTDATSSKPANPFDELSEEELKNRLKRAEKFNIQNDRVDAMKAALRKFRFASTSSPPP